MEIRNIAIIAHVDHGKTTLVDAMLKQTHTFRENQKEMSQTLILDSNDLEREKGITILAKNTSVFYKNSKINIIDTPGHADFGGEVERVLNMASGAILLVDASEGPLPQTKFVLKKALAQHLRLILVINKIDKKDARPSEIVTQVEDLFLELAEEMSSLHFSVLYAVGRLGKAFYSLPENYQDSLSGDLSPLFETILEEIPPQNPENQTQPFQMLISTLDYDQYVGKLCIGKVSRGSLKKNQAIALVDEEKILGTYKATKLFTTKGLERVEVEEIENGDIATIAGIPELTIGQTVTDPAAPESLPKIQVEEPTIKITIGPNTSPFSGQEGKFCTSRQIKERLNKERETNLGLKIEEDAESTKFLVHGRGELHLAVLLETMRREGYELEVSKPQVILKTIEGVVCEPYEEVTLEVEEPYVGAVTEEFGKRKGILIDLQNFQEKKLSRLVYKISEQNLLGIRSVLLTKTRGTLQMSTFFLGYFAKSEKMNSLRFGALVADRSGSTMAYSISHLQDRGTFFISPGEEVYEGMVIGLSNKEKDIDVNITKAKHLTNNRSAGEGVSIQITPATKLSLEQSLDFIEEDELLEITPKSLRMRKRFLSAVQRKISQR